MKKNYDIDELINSVFVEIKCRYKFMNLSDIDIFEQIKKMSLKVKSINMKKAFEELLNSVNLFYVYEIKSKIKKKDYTYVYDYIRNLDFNDDFINNIKCLKKIVKFLKKVNFPLNNDDSFDKLFLCDELKNYLYKICSTDGITRQSIENEVFDFFVLKIIDYYCLENGIELKNEDREFNDNCSSESEYSDDSIKSYLNLIGSIPRLDEIELIELIKEYKRTGDLDIRNKILNANLRLVVFMAKSYYATNIPFLDLIQEGNIGLMRAIDKFDVNKGVRFSTYATYWIRHSIIRLIDEQSDIIRFPIYIVEQLKKYNIEKNKFIEVFKREPSDEEMARCLNVSVEQILKYKELLVLSVTASLDFVFRDDDSLVLYDVLEDPRFSNPEDLYIDNSLRGQIEKSLELLTEKEKMILKLRFGFYNDIPETLTEVGKRYGITAERVRQIENKALKKLEKSKQCNKYLKDYL